MSVVILILVIAVLVGVLTGVLPPATPPGAACALKFVLLVPAALVAVGITFMLMARSTARQTRPVAVQWQSPVPRQMTVPAHDTQNLYAAQERAVDVFSNRPRCRWRRTTDAVTVEPARAAPLPQPLPSPRRCRCRRPIPCPRNCCSSRSSPPTA